MQTESIRIFRSFKTSGGMELNGDDRRSYRNRSEREDKQGAENTGKEEEEEEDEEEEEEEDHIRRGSDTQKKRPYLLVITFMAIAMSSLLCFDCISRYRNPTQNGLPSRWSYMLVRSKQKAMEVVDPYHNDQPYPSFSKLSMGRKLLRVDGRLGGGGGGGGGCTAADLAILQGETTPLPDGIPSFSVQVINLCSAARGPCSSAHDIHVSCGWFASAKLVNPRLFRRLRYNDCVVNDRRALRAGQSITFEYANSFQYPLAISSAITGCH